MSFAEGTVTSSQPYKYNGKELDTDRGLNLYDYSARYMDPALGRFNTVDPMAEKYYSISPYAYVGNNPMNAIDPDGMDVYILGQDGKMILAKKEDDNYDQLYASRKTGNGFIYLTGEKTTISDQSLLPQLSVTNMSKHASGVTSNSSDAFNVFKFAVDNSNVEWAMAGYKNSSGSTDYVLNTDFNEGEVRNRKLGHSPSDLIFHIHSHPGGDDTKVASGYADGLNYESGTDMGTMAYYYNIAKSENRSFPYQYPQFYIYHKESMNIYNYNYQTNSMYIGRTFNPKALRDLINKHIAK
jgi:RHS repeat-associated protein